MTPLEKIEKGILSGNWKLVCEAYYKLSGKKLEPPVQIKEFDPNKATKSELYKYAKSVNENLAPITAYTIKELREVISVFEKNSQPEPVQTVQTVQPQHVTASSGKVLDGFRYTSGKKIHPDDLKPIKAALAPELEFVKDPENFQYTPRNPAKKNKLTCMKCSKVYESTSEGVNIDGEIKGLCQFCSENP